MCLSAVICMRIFRSVNVPFEDTFDPRIRHMTRPFFSLRTTNTENNILSHRYAKRKLVNVTIIIAPLRRTTPPNFQTLCFALITISVAENHNIMFTLSSMGKCMLGDTKIKISPLNFFVCVHYERIFYMSL